MLKMCVSDWVSTFNEFFLNLRETSGKGERPQKHVRFITVGGQAGTFSNLTELGALSPIVLGLGITEEGMFCKVVSCKRLKLVRNPYKFK